MLIQQLRQMERDDVVRRVVHRQTSGPYMKEGAMTVDATNNTRPDEYESVPDLPPEN
jgi:hypothetical protein